jgi:hypothetical protein
MDKQLLEIFAAVVTIVGGFYAMWKWGRTSVVSLWRWLTRYRPRVPRETVRILPQVHGCRWNMGSVSGVPAMQVNGRWYATNITGGRVLLLGARLVNPATEGHIISVRHPERNLYGEFPILPGATTEVSALFWVAPPRRREGEDFVSDVLFLDQYGNRHKIKKVRFRGPPVPKLKESEPGKEAIHSIIDPIEKQIVSVLKAEISRYAECGRGAGGLGSIQTTLDGRSYAGVGTEWRESNSPKNQSLVLNTQQVVIESDNAAALINLYGSLQTEEEQTRFVAALLKRLSKITEYAPIGYFIFYVLFSIGHLSHALNTALKCLQGDAAYGFSDLLRLLDALLRFKHPEFDARALDNVERFTEGLTEDTFRIAERLAAIRAVRLSQQQSG